jgi:ribosomal protein L37E
MKSNKQSKAAYVGRSVTPDYTPPDYIQDVDMLLTSIKQEHSKECLQAFGVYYLALTLYERYWPHYCRTCKGQGGTYSYYDPSPAGVSLAAGQMEDFEPCSECVEKDICPRCGEKSTIDWDADKQVCSVCGFDCSYKMAAPQEPECFCYEEKRAERWGNDAGEAMRKTYRELGIDV